jgi:hypothetical protein
MGRIVTNIAIKNLRQPETTLTCNALVDTGAAYLVLPAAWRQQLGPLDTVRTIECETATQQTVPADVRGPVEIRLDGFAPIYGEVLFLEMHPADGQYEPRVGYIVLEQAQAAVDMLGHRLVHARKTDLKRCWRDLNHH